MIDGKYHPNEELSRIFSVLSGDIASGKMSRTITDANGVKVGSLKAPDINETHI